MAAFRQMMRTIWGWIGFSAGLLLCVGYWLNPMGTSILAKALATLAGAAVFFLLKDADQTTTNIKARALGIIFAVCGTLSVAGSAFNLKSKWERQSDALDRASDMQLASWPGIEARWKILCADNTQPLTPSRAIAVIGHSSHDNLQDLYWPSGKTGSQEGEKVGVGIRFNGVSAQCYYEYWTNKK